MEIGTPAGKKNSDLTVVFPQAVEITSLLMTDADAPLKFLASYIPANEDKYVPYKDGKLDPEVRCNFCHTNTNSYTVISCLSRNLLNSFRHFYHRY